MPEPKGEIRYQKAYWQVALSTPVTDKSGERKDGVYELGLVRRDDNVTRAIGVIWDDNEKTIKPVRSL